MLFSNEDRCLYARPAAHEVICQLLFPGILSIESREPADFQEEIRARFPLYARRQESLPASVFRCTGDTSDSRSLETVTNYHFVTEDHLWKLNLTKNFISLSTLRYTGWEDFAAVLDQTLAAFIRIYQPAFFGRIGLRYRNIISRSALELEDCEWQDLIHRAYLGALAEEDVSPAMVDRMATDLHLSFSESCRAHIHAGLVHMKVPGTNQAEAEEKFMLDMDLAMGGSISAQLVAGALETLHSHSTRIFRGAITDTLHEAMKPL
ncbi:MAG: TIGR04255 family protein [Oscillospiraceae bacterium]|nr:TIGR04255 family protein [Oscillospiraceae bacterium]